MRGVGGDWAAVDLGRPEKPQPNHRPDRALQCDAPGLASRPGALWHGVAPRGAPMGAPPGLQNVDSLDGRVECRWGRGAQLVESSGFGREPGPRQPSTTARAADSPSYGLRVSCRTAGQQPTGNRLVPSGVPQTGGAVPPRLQLDHDSRRLSTLPTSCTSPLTPPPVSVVRPAGHPRRNVST